MILPEEIKKFSDAFAELPGIGPRQALRLALRLSHDTSGTTKKLAQVLSDLEHLHICQQCFFPYSKNFPACPLCNDATRTQDIFMIVEKETDVIALEQSRVFHGRYCVIGPLTKSGVLDAEHKRRLIALKKTIETTIPEKKATEIIIGFSPTTVGDINAARVGQEVSLHARAITRLGRGIPTGGDIEFADDETLAGALLARTKTL